MPTLTCEVKSTYMVASIPLFNSLSLLFLCCCCCCCCCRCRCRCRGPHADFLVPGTCRLTREGEVRWTTFSIFGGQERWRSEGIQLGGVRSARGVVGNWFDKDFDPHGPCGPNGFWKLSDSDPKGELQRVLKHDFLPLMDGPVVSASDDEDDPDYEEQTGGSFEIILPDDLEFISFGLDSE